MRICVAHETVYRYEPPSSGVIQTLRLTPRNHTGQYVVDWRIEISTDCRLEPQEDAFGNLTHAFSAPGPVSDLRLMVEGEVETQDTAGVVRGAVERFPPSLFLRETPLTHADDAILAYAVQFPRPSADTTLATLHNLLTQLCEDIAWDTASNPVHGTAAEAFAGKRGASRDLAHIFISIARSLGVPARYVGGYFRRVDSAEEVIEEAAKEAAKDVADDVAPDAGHAWV